MFIFNDIVEVTSGFFQGCKGICLDKEEGYSILKNTSYTLYTVKIFRDNRGFSRDFTKEFNESELRICQS